MMNFHVMSGGIDIIEGIERGAEARKVFNVTFNFKLAENINIDSLLKNEMESLVKMSVM